MLLLHWCMCWCRSEQPVISRGARLVAVEWQCGRGLFISPSPRVLLTTRSPHLLQQGLHCCGSGLRQSPIGWPISLALPPSPPGFGSPGSITVLAPGYWRFLVVALPLPSSGSSCSSAHRLSLPFITGQSSTLYHHVLPILAPPTINCLLLSRGSLPRHG